MIGEIGGPDENDLAWQMCVTFFDLWWQIIADFFLALFLHHLDYDLCSKSMSTIVVMG
jgi:hypothetical protein